MFPHLEIVWLHNVNIEAADGLKLHFTTLSEITLNQQLKHIISTNHNFFKINKE